MHLNIIHMCKFKLYAKAYISKDIFTNTLDGREVIYPDFITTFLIIYPDSVISQDKLP